MTRFMKILMAGLVLAGAAGFARADAPAQAKKEKQPQVEVVFCLDTTGSMGGLIDAAKQKIWAICNQIVSGKPTPRVKIGLVAYRDRGDEYVTKVFDLTEDLDAMHGQLMSFRAAGGGDFPESVNQALHDAVTKIKWSTDKKTLKIIFLVGDAPPHMDYPDDVKYPETCKLACTKDIIINTIQCGNHPQTKAEWEKICRLAEGSYVQIDARGGPVVTVATPFDADLGKINSELARSTLAYGKRELREEGAKKAKAAAGLAPAAAAERAGFAGRSGKAASYDLLDSIKDGKVKLDDLKKDELPDELQKLTPTERKAYLEKLDKTRQELFKKAADLNKRRGEFIAKKLAEDTKSRARDSFDNQVLRVIQRQATRVNIRYEIDTPKK
jgi:Mg-chelatase subunit ChlD